MASFFDFLGGGAVGGKLFGAMDLTGSKARQDLQQSYADSSRMLDQGYNEARDLGERYYGDAQSRLDPYSQAGVNANRVIGNALGINGRDAQAGYFRDFQTDPGFQESVNYGIRGLDRSAAARGGLYSGAQLKALQGYGQTRMNDAHNTRIGHLLQYGQQGQQAAGAQAGIASQFGGDLMNLRYGYGQQGAQNRINFGNAMAENRGTLMKNLLGMGGVVAKAYGAMR